MNKKTMFMMVMLFLTLGTYTNIFAENEELGTIEVKSQTKINLEFNYFDEKKYNLMFTLDEKNNYSYTAKVPIGTYSFDYIVVPEDYEKENFDYPKTIVVEKDKTTNASISEKPKTTDMNGIANGTTTTKETVEKYTVMDRVKKYAIYTMIVIVGVVLYIKTKNK